MALGSQIQGETSYTQSFDCKVGEKGFLFIPRLPSGYVIDNELYQTIFLIANAALYPRYTLLKQNSAYFVPFETDDIHTQRGLYVPWIKGISKGLVMSDVEQLANSNLGTTIPIMENLVIDYEKVTSIAIAGNSGSGKSYALTYFLSMLKPISDLIVIDPKFDTQSRWARFNDIKVIHPEQNRSKSDFVSQINEELSDCLQLI